MPASAPLQILIFRHPADVDVAPYEEAIVRAFQGGKQAGGYLACGKDIGSNCRTSLLIHKRIIARFSEPK
jgi:hypothetical protein